MIPSRSPSLVADDHAYLTPIEPRNFGQNARFLHRDILAFNLLSRNSHVPGLVAKARCTYFGSRVP
jgi:hypothetical protein